MSKLDTIIGYIYAADTYCPECIIGALPTGEGGAFDGWALAPGAAPMSTEDNLAEIAHVFGINRDDETTFVSDDFPKVIVPSGDDATTRAYCAACEVTIGWEETAVSSGHFSHDQQLADAMTYLQDCWPGDYAAVLAAFPEWERVQWSGSWVDTDAMGVDPEWSSWLTDAVEETGRVWWSDGEPWAASV
jgi:hypothetical protein